MSFENSRHALLLGKREPDYPSPNLGRLLWTMLRSDKLELTRSAS